MWTAYRHFLGHVAVYDPMSATMAAVTGVGGALQAAGTLMGGNAAADAGRAQQGAQYFKATQEEQAAQESRAGQQRVALDKAREGRLLQSKLQAGAAASGGGASDPGVINLAQGIAGRSEFESLLEMYKGENRARGLEDQAIGSRMSGDAAKAEGEAKKTASRYSAAGTLIGSAGSAYKVYKGFG
jgi:hypothetical protein